MYYYYKANDGTTYRFPEPLRGSNTPKGETLGVDGNWYPGRPGLAATVYFSGDFVPVNAEDAEPQAKGAPTETDKPSDRDA
ncbi:hypothetical protein ABQE93_10745 [Mycolicibacterium sp. XJ662]